jgi:chromosome segregation ATPase
MAVDYLQEYLGIDPNDYSAMEQRIAGISPVGQSILPQAPVLPRASIMDEGDFAAATAPLMDRVYGREQAAREKSESLSNELQALQEEMARTSEAEVEKRAALERKMQEIMQQRDMSITNAESLATRIQELQEEMAATSAGEVEKRAALQQELDSIEQNLQQRTEERDVSVSQAEDLASQLQRLESDLGQTTEQRDLSRTRAEDLASELQGVQANLVEITNLRDIAVQDYQEALQQQDVIRQQASENEAMRLEEQRNELLAEREGIITTLEQDFGVQRSELESVIGGLEGQVGDLTGKVGELESVKGTLEGQINDLSSQMQALEVEKQDALAQQDVIRAEAAQSQQDALAQQSEQFATEKSTLEQQIADLTEKVL